KRCAVTRNSPTTQNVFLIRSKREGSDEDRTIMMVQDKSTQIGNEVGKGIITIERKKKMSIPKDLNLITSWNIMGPELADEFEEGYTHIPYILDTNAYKIGYIFVPIESMIECLCVTEEIVKVLGPLTNFVVKDKTNDKFFNLEENLSKRQPDSPNLRVIKYSISVRSCARTIFLDFQMILSNKKREIVFTGHDCQFLDISMDMIAEGNIMIDRSSNAGKYEIYRSTPSSFLCSIYFKCSSYRSGRSEVDRSDHGCIHHEKFRALYRERSEHENDVYRRRYAHRTLQVRDLRDKRGGTGNEDVEQKDSDKMDLDNGRTTGPASPSAIRLSIQMTFRRYLAIALATRKVDFRIFTLAIPCKSSSSFYRLLFFLLDTPRGMPLGEKRTHRVSCLRGGPARGSWNHASMNPPKERPPAPAPPRQGAPHHPTTDRPCVIPWHMTLSRIPCTSLRRTKVP
ncbi:hypothetical protein V1478_014649, partial [Vespula squamosa]